MGTGTRPFVARRPCMLLFLFCVSSPGKRTNAFARLWEAARDLGTASLSDLPSCSAVSVEMSSFVICGPSLPRVCSPRVSASGAVASPHPTLPLAEMQPLSVSSTVSPLKSPPSLNPC